MNKHSSNPYNDQNFVGPSLIGIAKQNIYFSYLQEIYNLFGNTDLIVNKAKHA